MIKINLLPAEIQSAPTKMNPAVPIGAALILPSMGLVPYHLSQIHSKNKLDQEVTILNAELERYKPIIAQVEQLEGAKKQLEQRKGVIQTLEDERLRYPQFFDDFLRLLPNNLWLNTLTTTLQTGNAIGLQMDVTALDNYALADLIANLESSQMFTDVDLGSINFTQNAQGASTLTFHVSTTYRKSGTTPNAPKKS